MPEITSTAVALESIRAVRQVRQYEPGTVEPAVLDQLLEIARWTGSSRNTQPWHFIVVEDKEQLAALADLRENITWAANGALAIAIVMPGGNLEHEAYDAGRVTERLMIAARMLGYGAGTAWFGEPHREAKAKELLGVGDDSTVRSMVVIGPYVTSKDPRPTGPKPGRKPLSEIVSYGRLGESKA
jgi:nitroreductase